jgi:hypothetical protein
VCRHLVKQSACSMVALHAAVHRKVLPLQDREAPQFLTYLQHVDLFGLHGHAAYPAALRISPMRQVRALPRGTGEPALCSRAWLHLAKCPASARLSQLATAAGLRAAVMQGR